MNYNKKCVLNDKKTCNNCLECDLCDIEPGKICNNCCKCIEVKEFAAIKIDKIIDASER